MYAKSTRFDWIATLDWQTLSPYVYWVLYFTFQEYTWITWGIKVFYCNYNTYWANERFLSHLSDRDIPGGYEI